MVDGELQEAPQSVLVRNMGNDDKVRLVGAVGRKEALPKRQVPDECPEPANMILLEEESLQV